MNIQGKQRRILGSLTRLDQGMEILYQFIKRGQNSKALDYMETGMKERFVELRKNIDNVSEDIDKIGNI